MVEKTAIDYANLLKSVNPESEINPICAGVEDLMARLDEFETLFSSVKAENNSILENHIRGILDFGDNFQQLRDRIDKLEKFVEIVHTNVNVVEKKLDIAEEELNVTDYSFRGLLKPLLAKANKADGAEAVRTNLKDGEYQPIQLFKTTDYFGTAELDSTEEAREQSACSEEIFHMTP